MTAAQSAAYVTAMSACMLVEMEGMRAENATRERRGEALAYGDDDFAKLLGRYGVDHAGVMKTFGAAS